MGTRAQFFIGNPEHVDNRIWLGCTACDGYCPGWTNPLSEAKSEEDFVRLVKEVAGTRDDFCDPAVHGFPFPWVDDLFLTDYTYAWFDGKAMVTAYHRGWIEMTKLMNLDEDDPYHDDQDELPRNTPAPSKVWDRSAPDGIIIVRAVT